MQDVLRWATRVAAVAALLPAFFAMWYLAGADDRPRSPVAPVAGLGLFLAAGWGAVIAFTALEQDPWRVLAVLTAPPLLLALSWPFAGTRATGRPPLAGHLRDAAVLAVPAALAAAYLAST